VSLQEAFINTIVKIKSCTRASASGKNEYNLERTKNRDKYILVLEKNEMPKDKISLSKEQKKEIKSLQSKLSTYKKRLTKAIEDGKEKSIKTNQKNIDKISADLSKIEKSDNRQKHFTEFTVALTNSKKGEYVENWSELALEHFKQEFPTLQVVSAVEHRDQHSPHMHILLHSPDKPITEVLSEKNFINKDTSREAMKSAYSKIAHTFHSFANEKIAHKELKPLQKGLKYVSLGQYKSKGNFEAKKALQSKNNTLPALKAEIPTLKELNSELTSIKNTLNNKVHLRPYQLEEHDIPLYSKKKLLNNLNYITSRDMQFHKKELDTHIDRVGAVIKADVTSPKKRIDALWSELEKNSKERKKEARREINPEYFKQWKHELNKYLKEFDAQVQKIINSIKLRKEALISKIEKHPDTIKQKQQERERDKQRQEQRKQKKDRGMER